MPSVKAMFFTLALLLLLLFCLCVASTAITVKTVCVPVHITLNEKLYIVYRTDTLDTFKRIFYTAR